MRRRLATGVLFALALAVQALAPAAAHIAMARGDRSNVLFANSPSAICLPAAGAAADGRDRSPGQRGSGDACPLCQICCSGVAPLQTRPVLVGSAPVQRRMVAWTAADRAAPTTHRSFAHRARAPPVFS